MVELLTFVVVYFIFQYSMIISLEEEKLSILFGKELFALQIQCPTAFTAN